MTVGIGAIKQSDVETEIGLSPSLLSECFTSAASVGFDPTYEGSHNMLGNFQNYTHPTFFISTPDPLEFYYDDTPYTDRYIAFESNFDWYCTVDTTEITSAYVDSSSGSAGSNQISFYCGETNYDAFSHSSQVDFYKTSDDSYLGSISIVQYNS